MTTRPTPDRVKESLFSILGGQVPDATVLDLFAGTGALGLEALSRGAKFCSFVEQDRQALGALRKNIEAVGLIGNEVLALPAARAVSELARRGRRYDLVFLDPPYESNQLGWALAELEARGLILPQAVLVCEHHGREPAPAVPAAFAQVDHRTFGDVGVSILSYVKGSNP